MKVPPTNAPPDKAPTYDKDRTLTRRTVAGAAGGLKGVDYEDDRRPAPGEEQPATTGGAGGASAAGNAAARAGERGADHAAMPAQERTVGSQPDPSKVVPDEEAQQPAPLHTRRRRRFVARDRFTIDKDAPERRRARRPQEEDEDETTDERSTDQTFEVFADSVGEPTIAPGVSRAQLFTADTRPEPGDLSLTDPEAIQRALETPLAYAKHAMILAEAFRRSAGATRGEAIDYLARLLLSPRDRTFARSALKEFGPSSGILDVYPLEVVVHVLERYPGFLPKVSLGSFFHQSGARAQVWRTDTRTPLVLEYPEELKIRGFALEGGGRPGYRFEPDDVVGRYRLWVQTPGRWSILVSGVSRTGHTTVDAGVVEVRLAPGDQPPPPVVDDYPARDPARVAAWPVPARPNAAELAEPDTTPPREEARLSTGELLHQRALDDERRLRDIDLEVSEADAPIADRGDLAETLPEPGAPAARPHTLPPKTATDPRARALVTRSADTPARAPPPKAVTGAGARPPARPAATDEEVPTNVELASLVDTSPDEGARAGRGDGRAETSGVLTVRAEAASAPRAARGDGGFPPRADGGGAERADGTAAGPRAETSGAFLPRADGAGFAQRADGGGAQRADGGGAQRADGTAAGRAETSGAFLPRADGTGFAQRGEAGGTSRTDAAGAGTRSTATSGAPKPRGSVAPPAAHTKSPPPARAAPTRAAPAQGRAEEPARPAAEASRRTPRPRPKPRGPEPEAPAARTAVDRAELTGAIADAFARLAATPIAAAGAVVPPPPAFGAPAPPSGATRPAATSVAPPGAASSAAARPGAASAPGAGRASVPPLPAASSPAAARASVPPPAAAPSAGRVSVPPPAPPSPLPPLGGHGARPASTPASVPPLPAAPPLPLGAQATPAASAPAMPPATTAPRPLSAAPDTSTSPAPTLPAAVLAVRPRAPLLDDTDASDGASGGEPEELDASAFMEVDPTARIAVHAELAADLLLESPPSATARVAARPLRSPHDDELDDDPDPTIAMPTDRGR